MQLFKHIPVFDRKTGKPDGFEYKENGFLCDYTGETFKKNDHDTISPYCINIAQIGGCEETWYYDDIEWLDNVQGKGYFLPCTNLDELLRFSRSRVLKKVLATGTINVE